MGPRAPLRAIVEATAAFAAVATVWLGVGRSAQAAAPAGCLPALATDGPGMLDPFHVPSDRAKQLNADALGAYRKGRFAEARAAYRAAEAADPLFLAPALNIACSFVRQEQLPEALAEVKRLLDRAFLPWSDEVLTAADLGALKVGAEGKQLRALLDRDRRAWAAGLSDDVIFVARTRAPLKLARAADGTDPGTDPQVVRTLVLGPRQEVFAWSPRTLRYRQVTAEQGRVLALAVSRDRRRISYVTAEKLVLAPRAAPALRGVVIKEVDLGTLSPVGEAHPAGDLRRLEIVELPVGFAYRFDVEARDTRAGAALAVRDGRLQPISVARAAKVLCALTGQGVAPIEKAAPLPGDCQGTVRDGHAPDGSPTVDVLPDHVRGSAGRRTISGPFGGGQRGLPLP